MVVGFRWKSGPLPGPLARAGFARAWAEWLGPQVRAGFALAAGTKPILANVSFELNPGESLGVIGPSASGKSVGTTKTDINAFFTGSWSFNVKYRLLRVEDQPVGLAIIGAVDVPLGSDTKTGYASDPRRRATRRSRWQWPPRRCP